MSVSLDDPIENLKLSNRTRNALRRMGCATLGSVINHEAEPASRRSGFGFGPVSRAEVACALAANGFTSWAELMLADAGVGRAPAAKPCAQSLNEFKGRLTMICIASAGLLGTKTLSPDQREFAELIEAQSVQLRELLQGWLDPPQMKAARTRRAR
jgi:hypothetical protein